MTALSPDRLFGLGWALAPKLPWRPTAAVVDLVARGIGRWKPPAQYRANLRQVVGPDVPEGELDRLVALGVRSYARYWHEALRLPTTDRRDVSRRTVFTGVEHIREPLAAGRGVILALGHFGNWDAAAIPVIDDVPARMMVVAERLEPAELWERFKRYRESLRMEVVPLSGDASAISAHLRGGGLVCLLCDRDLTGKGVPVTLAGRATTMAAGPAMLAVRTGAALLPTHLGFTRDGWFTTVSPELPVPEGRLREQVAVLSQQIADHFTDLVRRTPTDWHMFQRVWPDVGP